MSGYEEMNEYLEAVKGECLADFTMDKKKVSKVTVKAVDVAEGIPVQGALLKAQRIITWIAVDGQRNHECRGTHERRRTLRICY